MNNTHPALQKNGARTLALGGIGLVIAGLLIGEIYAIFVSHVANGIIKSAWIDAMHAAVAGNPDALNAAFERIAELSDKRGRFMSAHSHVGAYGLLALGLAVIYPGYRQSAGKLRLPALLLLSGAWAHITGTFASHYFAAPATWIAVSGQVLVITALLSFTVAWVRGDASALAANLGSRLLAGNSRWLTACGLALLLGGMAFGLWFALALTGDLEPRMFTAMRSAVAAAANGAANDAAVEISRFKTLQSKIAITAAAHSHAIEFGFLLLLLAFLEPFVMLSRAWRKRWTFALIAGACLLPVSVFLATIYGLTAAAFADIGGALALLGLIGMFTGILRATGAEDRVECAQ